MAAMIKLCSEMRKAFQEDLEVLLGQIAVEFGIDHDALLDFAEVKRKESSETVSEAVTESKAKKARKTKKAKAPESESEGSGAEQEPKERAKCAAKTAKGTACKNNALADCEFCRVHNKGPLALPKAKEVDQVPKEEKKKRSGRGKKAAEPKPEHNHSADEAPKAEEPCERCEAPEYSVDPDLEAQLAEFKAELEAEMDPDYVPDGESAAGDDE